MKLIKERSNMCTYHIKEMLFVNNFRKIIIKLGVYIILLCVAVFIALTPNFISSKKHVSPHRHARFATDLKYILFWKQPKRNRRNFYNKDIEYTPGQSLFIKQNCPFINCYITYNKSLLREDQDFDAIVFNVHDIRKLDVNDLNLTRSPYQKYIYKSLESAEKHPICNPSFDDFFNWTWTYKLNSDIPHPFINIHDGNNNLVGPRIKVDWIKKMKNSNRHKNRIINKDKAVAWIVNNCQFKTKHHEYIKELKDELKGYNYTLDTFGPCSENKCPGGRLTKCYKMVEQEYFFQLLIEDSFSEDYVTDKIVKALAHISIPIVLGGANYRSFLPPGSYINAQAFELKKLGAVIDYLIKNPKKYSYFFDWKNHYYYTVRPRSYICDLCTKLNQNNSVTEKTYKHFRQWWNPDFIDSCQRIHLLNLFKNLD